MSVSGGGSIWCCSHVSFVVRRIDLLIRFHVLLGRQLVKRIVCGYKGGVLHFGHLFFHCFSFASILLHRCGFLCQGLLELGRFGIPSVVKGHLLSKFGVFVEAEWHGSNHGSTLHKAHLFVKGESVGAVCQRNLPKLETDWHCPKGCHFLGVLQKDGIFAVIFIVVHFIASEVEAKVVYLLGQFCVGHFLFLFLILFSLCIVYSICGWNTIYRKWCVYMGVLFYLIHKPRYLLLINIWT